MSFFDAAIIYMAFGVPFGVYGLTAASRRPLLGRVARFVPRFLAWPAVLLRFAYRQWITAKERADITTRVEALRREMEMLAFSDAPTSDVFNFRDIFYRYVGLSLANDAPVGCDHIRGLAEIGEVHDQKTAVSCSARRNREKITLHHDAARADLIALTVDKMIATHEFVDRAIELASLVNDPIAMDRLSLAEATNTSSIQPSQSKALAA